MSTNYAICTMNAIHGKSYEWAVFESKIPLLSDARRRAAAMRQKEKGVAIAIFSYRPFKKGGEIVETEPSVTFIESDAPPEGVLPHGRLAGIQADKSRAALRDEEGRQIYIAAEVASLVGGLESIYTPKDLGFGSWDEARKSRVCISDMTGGRFYSGAYAFEASRSAAEALKLKESELKALMVIGGKVIPEAHRSRSGKVKKTQRRESPDAATARAITLSVNSEDYLRLESLNLVKPICVAGGADSYMLTRAGSAALRALAA